MLVSRLLFRLQGKSIPHICYELFLLPERWYRNIFTLPSKILCFYLIQEPWLHDWFLLYLLWLFRVHWITNILFIWAVGDRLFPIVFLPCFCSENIPQQLKRGCWSRERWAKRAISPVWGRQTMSDGRGREEVKIMLPEKVHGFLTGALRLIRHKHIQRLSFAQLAAG